LCEVYRNEESVEKEGVTVVLKWCYNTDGVARSAVCAGRARHALLAVVLEILIAYFHGAVGIVENGTSSGMNMARRAGHTHLQKHNCVSLSKQHQYYRSV
jgi:hypothetical protein